MKISKKRFGAGSVLAAAGMCSVLSLVYLLSCNSGSSVSKTYNSWSFSGYVIDGNSSLPLSKVGITYLDKDGVTLEEVTDSAGKFYINELPFGERSFQFTYHRIDSTSSLYTQKIVTASSYTESKNVDGIIGDVSKVVSLYPLTGAVSGEAFIKLSGSEKTIPARNESVKVSYKDSNLVNSTPTEFAATADSMGQFYFTGLPLAPGATLTLNSYAVKGITYSCDPVTISQLFRSKSVSLGNIFLTAKDSTNMAIGKVRSNVLSADGFGLSGIPVDVKLWYVMPSVPVPASITASITGGGSPNATVLVKTDTVVIVPVKKFTFDSLVTVAISGVDTAGNRIAFTFDGVKQFRTEKQKYPLVRSNVLSLDGLGLTGIPVDATLWYALPCIPAPSSIGATISGGGSPGAAVRVSGDTVFVDPVKNFGYDSLVTVTITGVDTAGNRIEFVFDSAQQFKTKKGVYPPVRSNVLSIDGFGLTGVPVDVKLWYVLPCVPAPSSVAATISGGGSPSAVVRVNGDTVFVNLVKNFGYDSLVTVAITGVDTAGNRIEFTFDDVKRFRTQKGTYPPVRSNVLSVDGIGLTGVPVDVKLWYALPSVPVPSSVTTVVSGGGSPNVLVRVKGDTVFIDPVKNFSYDSPVTVTITGVDTAGNRIEFPFDGTQQFRTEKGIFPVASNTWRTPGSAQRAFQLNDTLWVKFSEPLDADVNKIDWSQSSAQNTIFGKGPSVNADVWVGSDTLFVRPDQRLAINYGQTMGFKVNVVSVKGKRSDSLDVVAPIVADNCYVKWTNTKDQLGNMRQDFGTLDSVVVVSNAPLAEIKGLSGMPGKSVPPALNLDNVRLRGDTIIYKPSLYLKPDSTYGLDFDVRLKDGTLRYNVLGVAWKTALRIQILSVNNRQAGAFRPFSVIGDSLVVTFSRPVDTSAGATIPFAVTMTDVRSMPVKSIVKWDSSCKTVTIFNTDTLPTADFDAAPAYSSDAVYTQAVKSVTFNLVTKDGEQVLGLKPKSENIEIHTERGLCVVAANIVRNHDSRNDIDRSETAVDDLPLGGAVRVTFSRALDTGAMVIAKQTKFIGIKAGSTAVAATVALLSDGKTITVTPDSSLKPATDYYVWMKGIPGFGIAGAAAINKDAGSFSGKSTNYYLLDKAFQAK
jgi:hypothetical protein